MKKRWLYLFLIFHCISCQKAPFDFLIEEGAEKTEVRKPGAFSFITINDLFEITLVPDTTYSVSITCGKNIIPFVSTINNNGNLTIDNKIEGRWSRSYNMIKLQINMPRLDTIQLNNTSNITTIDTLNCVNAYVFVLTDLADVNLNIKGNFLYFHTARTSSGHYKVQGRLESAYILCGGTSTVDSRELFVKKGTFWNNSIADMSVFASQEISDLKNLKTGKIFIYGHPSKIVYTDVSDSSRIIFK